MSSHWASIGEAGALTGLRIMVWVNNRLGRTAFNIVLVPVMSYFFVRRSEARKGSIDYIRRVKRLHPELLSSGPVLWLSFRHFFTFGQALLDKYLAWMEPPEGINMDPEVRESHAALVESGKGILIIGSHFGNLEYSRSVGINRGNVAVNILLHDKHAEKFATLMRTSASQSRVNLMRVTDLDLDLALQLKEKVANGEWVLIAGDRVPVDSHDKVSAATFFGDRANFPIGPFVLANLLRCPVYLLHCFRKQGQYHLSMELFAEQIQPSRKNKRRNYDKEVQKFATALERQVRQAPLQWFNFYDFWGPQDPTKPQSDRLQDDD